MTYSLIRGYILRRLEIELEYMTAIKRNKTNYPGVFFREGQRLGGRGIEKIYYIVFKDKNGKVIEEKAGRQYSDDMTPARASAIRSERIDGKRLSRKEIRDQQKTTQETVGPWIRYGKCIKPKRLTIKL